MTKIIRRTTNAATKFCIILLVLSNLNATAQRRKTAAEFSIHAGGGFETAAFRPPSNINSSVGYGGEFGIGFTGYFNYQWGIHLSAGFCIANIHSKRDSLYHLTKGLVDEHGYRYNLHTTLFGYSEIHKKMGITIPVMLLFQTKQRHPWHWQYSKVGFYAMGGMRMHLLFNNKYETSATKLYNAAYYVEQGVIIDTQEFAGLGFANINSGSEGKIKFGIMASVALETGVKWRLDRNIFFYTGVYFDCGLNDPFKNDRESLGNYTSKKQIEKHLGILQFPDKMNLLAVGVKVRIGFWRLM